MTRAPDHVIRERIRKMHADQIPRSIQDAGQQLIAVGADPPFIYTIGMHLAGRRELILIGSLEPWWAVVLGELCAARRRDERDYRHGEEVSVGGKFPLVALDADRPETKTGWTVQAGQQFDHEDYRVTQLVMCDPDGKLPWEVGCRSPWRDIPMLGALP